MTEKKLIYRNYDCINEITAKHESVLPLFQSFVSECKELDITVSNATISEAISNPEQYAINQFRKQLPEPEIKTIGKFKTKPVDILESLQLPSLVSIKKLSDQLKRVSDSITFMDINDYVVTISKTSIDILIEKYSVYAETPEQIKYYEIVNELCQVSKKLIDYLHNEFKDDQYPNLKSIIDFITYRKTQNGFDIFPSVDIYLQRFKIEERSNINLPFPDVKQSTERLVATSIK